MYATAHNYQDAATKYAETDLQELVREQAHLNSEEKQDLMKILQKFPTLFEGLNNRQLGIFPNKEYHIDLMLCAKPYHIKQPYADPLNQKPAVRKELERQLNRIGAISILIKKVRDILLVKTRVNFFIISTTKAQDVGRIDNDVAVANTKDKPTWLLILVLKELTPLNGECQCLSSLNQMDHVA